MYVNAPHLDTAGVLEETKSFTYRSTGSRRFATLSLAEAALNDHNQSGSYTSGLTRRSLLQSGIVSYKRYINTPYTCEYHELIPSPLFERMYREAPASGRFFGSSNRLRMRLNGGSQNEVYTTLGDINFLAGLPTVTGIYNRALIINTENKAIAECRIKAASMQMDLAETVSGLDKTVVMVAERSSQVLKAWGAARRGNFRAVFRHLGLDHKKLTAKDVSGKWLELQYGWLPLLSDIHSGTELIKDFIDPLSKPPPIQATRRQQVELAVADPSIPSDWVHSQTTKSAGAAVEVKFKFKVGSPFWAYLNSLQVLNPAYLAWVSLPFSFVVDWMLPVADMLSAVTSPIGLDFESGYMTTRSWGQLDVTAGRVESPPGTVLIRQSAGVTCSHRAAIMRRRAFNGFPGFMPYFVFPFASEVRATSAIALMEQQRRR